MRIRSLLVAALGAVTLIAACSTNDDSSDPGGSSGNPPGTPPPGGTPPGDNPPVTPPPTGFVSTMNTTRVDIDVDGASRTYTLQVPKSYDAQKEYALVIALHGDGQGGGGFVEASKLERFSGDEAILAFPDGSEDLTTPYDQNTDQKLIAYVIGAVQASHNIDPNRIWGFGFSKGGYQLGELACRKPGMFTAMALHAAGAPQERDEMGQPDCPTSIGIPMFVVQGELDGATGSEFLAQYFAGRASCDGTRSPSTPAMCEAYDNCDVGTPVVFCVVPGHPHDPLYPNAAEDSWAWFKSL